MPSDNDHVESGAHIAAPSTAAPTYPQIISPNFLLPSPMRCHGDVTGNWDFFKQQWWDYEIATGLDKREESVRLATLRSSMGRECLEILLNPNLAEEDKKKIDKCLEALENYFKPSRNLVYEWYVFNTCVQQTEETIQSYVTRLRKLAATCEYGALTDELIRDSLVIRLKNQDDKVRLLREKSLDLKKAIEMCTTSEIASKQIKMIAGAGNNKPEDVKKFSDKKICYGSRSSKRDEGRSSNSTKKSEKKRSKGSSDPTCKYCGRKQRHERRTECPAFKKTCSKCQKIDHFASVFRSSKKVQQFEEDEDDSSDESCLQVETVSLVQTKAKQSLADIEFCKSAKVDFTTTLACQLDTGATSVEPSEWISSMVIVAKPQKIRICLDPKDLNRAIQRPKFQMPTLEELLPDLNKARIFSSFDAKDGFYQVGLDQESSKLTTFWTPLGRYRYLRMPFAISLAPEAFESRLQECLADLPGVKVIRDDILVVGYGVNDSEALLNHDQNVVRLLERAKQVLLKLNKNKVKLRQAEVKFMGHVISRDGLKPDPDKVTAIKNMPKSTTKPEVLTLLGFVNYLSKFLPKLSDESAPLRVLTTKQSKFAWAKQHDEAFATVQQLVTQHLVLKFYSIEEEVTIQTDASNKGLGIVLLQNGQPVAFASRTLSPAEQSYATIEKECLGIVFACERFNQYLARRN
ncbi:Retrovirus-related Pol polyprotein from transposon 17.6 [Stylophora pistillata]|uniref:Retrovirus-related Pol polyprotein from transposon 17.6 n=1 Tax=Stylophora pistillata TaxID=50429 RepID=A0A2B4RQ82_STYPI|nr:Retrovirus-related Pol polyprotein from transposon 17.6 [Stylophora pistillata]